MPEWLDVLKRCQKAGKVLQLHNLTIDEAKGIHYQLSPVGLVYCDRVGSVNEVEDFCRWLEKNS